MLQLIDSFQDYPPTDWKNNGSIIPLKSVKLLAVYKSLDKKVFVQKTVDETKMRSKIFHSFGCFGCFTWSIKLKIIPHTSKVF